ncbi:coiled-coil domain-containing protein 117 [Rhinoderma darwinii]|uniref:coiled-coil domain-containing protein 117 n=1 Tax=Rhinoderma darwinii TaxID=43563 RepID=UPI003F67CD84
MAVFDRAFSAVPLYGMEYHQTSHPFLQRTNSPGIVDASLLGASVSERCQINSLPIASGLNSNGSYFNMHNQFNANPCPAGENGLFVGAAAQYQSPEGITALSQTNCTGQRGRLRKHRCQEDNNDCPLKKRRVSASPTPPVFQEFIAGGIFAGGSGQPFWASSDSQVKTAVLVPTAAEQSSAMMHTAATEDMEEVAVESQSDAALRRIRDIESRLVVEDEEDDHSRHSHLPTLVMSDVLVEGFKIGLDESLTQKIVDSINRPSMELVVWKPQPEFLVNKLQSIASSCKNDKVTKKVRHTPEIPLLQKIDPLGADKPCTSNLDTDLDTMWNREEEEMEL